MVFCRIPDYALVTVLCPFFFCSISSFISGFFISYTFLATTAMFPCLPNANTAYKSHSFFSISAEQSAATTLSLCGAMCPPVLGAHNSSSLPKSSKRCKVTPHQYHHHHHNHPFQASQPRPTLARHAPTHDAHPLYPLHALSQWALRPTFLPLTPPCTFPSACPPHITSLATHSPAGDPTLRRWSYRYA